MIFASCDADKASIKIIPSEVSSKFCEAITSGGRLIPKPLPVPIK